ncbi:MAG: TIGR02444 family protein [Pseudomonadota bacterium]
MLDSTALDSTRFAALQQAPLWDFALAVYTRPGVEQACLTLQDTAAVDVCELLFHGWLFAHGLEARPEALSGQRQVCREWQAGVTEVLRGLRRDLKRAKNPSDTVSLLRERIKQAELLAERENLQRWQRWAWDADRPWLRLQNKPTMPDDAGSWLQERLLSPQGLKQLALDEVAISALHDAFEVLGHQLDPLHRAR